MLPNQRATVAAIPFAVVILWVMDANVTTCAPVMVYVVATAQIVQILIPIIQPITPTPITTTIINENSVPISWTWEVSNA